MRTFLVPLLLLGLGALSPRAALATPVFASSVASTTGAITGDPTVTLGPPDALFVQLSDAAQITLSFPSAQGSTGVLRVFNFDTAFPAAAKIELSADNVFFVQLVPPVGTLFYDSSPGRILDIAFDLGAISVSYVRFTDHPGSIDGDFSAGGMLGFDLDAVAIVPEPATASLCLLGLGLVACRARCLARRCS